MKHKTAKLSEPGMRFFTPDLYLRFNSSKDEVANCANAEWDEAIEAYRKHISDLLTNMPTPVKELSKLTLHDAEIVTLFEGGASFPFPSPYWPAVALMILRQDEKLLALIYSLWNKIKEKKPSSDWPFTETKVHWLYDEIDAVIESHPFFLHRILLSDGRVLQIPFITAQFHEIPANESDGKSRPRRKKLPY
jgi:hypothetical protein